MISSKTMLTVAAVGVLVATPAFAQRGTARGATGGSIGAPGTGIAPGVPAPGIPTPGTPGGGLTPSTPPPMGTPLDPSASPAPPRPTQSTPAPGLDNPTGAIPGTLGSTPSGIGDSTGGAASGAIPTPLPQGGTAPSTSPGSSTIQR